MISISYFIASWFFFGAGIAFGMLIPKRPVALDEHLGTTKVPIDRFLPSYIGPLKRSHK